MQFILHEISFRVKKRHAGSFGPIAERILNKWEPILRGDMPNVRWLTTDMSLKYLSTAQNHGKQFIDALFSML